MPEWTLVPERKATSHVYYSMTKSLCGTCKTAVDAKIVIRHDAVYFEKFCPSHGRQECLVSSSAEWYLDCLTFLSEHRPPKRVMKEVKDGCPFDCGACSQHQQKVYLPVVPITSACNLDCPICYTINKNENAHMLGKEEFESILRHLAEDHDELDIINFTGGEPTLHPQLLDFLQMCRDAGIRRRRKTAVPAQGRDRYRRIDLTGNANGVVARSVVDEDHFECRGLLPGD